VFAESPSSFRLAPCPSFGSDSRPGHGTALWPRLRDSGYSSSACWKSPMKVPNFGTNHGLLLPWLPASMLSAGFRFMVARVYALWEEIIATGHRSFGSAYLPGFSFWCIMPLSINHRLMKLYSYSIGRFARRRRNLGASCRDRASGGLIKGSSRLFIMWARTPALCFPNTRPIFMVRGL